MGFNPVPLKQRADLHRALRQYFDSHDYLEVDTPLLTETIIPEASIELFRTELRSPRKESQLLFLVPSPEVWLKKLLAQGAPSLYQISKCFRNGEQLGAWHRFEFSMLEWYRLESSAEDNLSELQKILRLASEVLRSDKPQEISGTIRTMSMEEAFCSWAGFSLEKDLSEAGLAELSPLHPDYSLALKRAFQILNARLAERGLPMGREKEEDVDDLFHRLFLTLVEESLPVDRPLALIDWPSLIPTLARRIPSSPWAERWEVYLKGKELANCYAEENDRDILEAYWNKEQERKKKAKIPFSVDPYWPASIASGMPRCSGVALGLDRLLALIRGDDNLTGLDLFPIRAMLSS